MPERPAQAIDWATRYAEAHGLEAAAITLKANKTYGYDAKLPLVCEVYLLALGAHLQAMKDAKERRERGEKHGGQCGHAHTRECHQPHEDSLTPGNVGGSAIPTASPPSTGEAVKMVRGATPEATRTLVRNFEDPDCGNATFSATAFWERAWGKPKTEPERGLGGRSVAV